MQVQGTTLPQNFHLLSIYNKAKQITGSQAENINDLLKDVRERQLVEMSKLFDVMPYRSFANQDVVLRELTEKSANLFRIKDDMYIAAGELAKVIVAIYSEKQLNFWQQGLELVKPSVDNGISQNEFIECPFCGEQTISGNKLGEIRARSTSGQELSEKRLRVKEITTALQNIVIEIGGLLHKISFSVLPKEKIEGLKKMFSQGQNQLDEFIMENKDCCEKLGEIKNNIAELTNQVNVLQSEKLSPEGALKPTKSIVALVNSLSSLLPIAIISLQKYSRMFVEFQPILQRELSDEETVAKFTSLINLLLLKTYFDLVVRARDFDVEILRSKQTADEYILERQKEMVSKREQDILVWYGLLSPNPDVKFTGLIPGKDEYNLKATAFGRELNAAASLSQSQLNCLGLSVYIPSIVAPDAPFGFIAFDDPVQAMDDEHHESFLIKVIPELIDNRSRQVVVLTHLKHTADRLRSLNYEKNPVYYKFDKLTASGPQIKLYIVFKDETDQIQALMNGNEESRDLAVDRMRILCELIMREMHIKVQHVSMPDTIQSSRQMHQVFRALKGVSSGYAKQILDTINWSDPSHHLDPTWQTPRSPDIKLHLDRLQSIIGSLGLCSE